MALDKPLASALGVSDDFVMNALTPAFPLVRMKVIEDADAGDSLVELRVAPGVRDLLAPLAPDGDVMLYIVPDHSIGWWQQEMTRAFQVLASLGIFPHIDAWIKESRDSMERIAEQRDVAVELKDDGELVASESVLEAVGLAGHVKKSHTLFAIAATALQEKKMDLGTLIYRMAMSICHHADAAGTIVQTTLDNPDAAYTSMINSEIGPKLKSMDGLDQTQKSMVTKLVVSFAIASYVYRTVKART